jgi:phage host-nuclease inhibitor protein Gam
MYRLTEPLAGESALNRIEKRAREYADIRAELATLVTALQEKIEALTREKLPVLKRLAARAAERHAELEAAVLAAPQLFEKPRTAVFHGIKVGFRKNEGRIEFEDADALVERIQELMEEPEHYLRTVITPDKEALATLPGHDLKRLGCRLVETTDAVVIKPVAGDLEKQITALLKDAMETEA